MGRRGPPPEPAALKLLKGNPGKRKISDSEPKLPREETTPPQGLAGRDLSVWTGLASDMAVAGIFKRGDGHVFRAFCEVVADLEEVTALCRKVGAESALKLGYLKRVDVLRKQLREYSAILGLNPSSRSAIKVTPPESKDDPTSDFLFGKPKVG